MAIKKVVVEVSTKGLKEATSEARGLNKELNQAEKPRKVRAASAALSASEPTGLGRGTAAAKGRGDARDFGREAQGLGGLVHLYATFAANVFAVGAAFSALSKAADFSNMQKAADILSLKVGTSINSLAKDMQNLTDGAISMSDALSQASLAASAGLNTSQIKELTTVAKGASIALGRDMSDAMQRVFRGTIKIEPELLDELGLMVKVDDANKKYAKTLNKTISSLTDYERRQAFVNAVTEQGISKYKELANQSVNPYSKLLASIHDLGTGILGVMNGILGPFMGMLSTSPTALLLGLGAIVSLLLKQAVPAIGNVRAGWEAADKAAAKSIKNQLDYINQKKAANLKVASDEVKATQTALTVTRDVLEKSVKESTLAGTGFGKNIRQLTWGTDPTAIKKTTEEALAGAKALTTKLQEELRKKQVKIAIGVDKKAGGFADDTKLTRGIRDAALLETKLKDVALAEKQILAHSAAAGIAASAEASIHKKDPGVIAAERDLSKLEKLSARRAALSSAYDVTETLGTRAGFSRMNEELSKLGKEHSKLDMAVARTRGSFGILTTTISKGLGTFSVWTATIGIGVVALSALFSWLGLTTDKLTKLEETTNKLSESFKLYSSIQEKISTSGSLAETFTLQASAATAYAEALELAAQKAKELSIFREQKGFSGAIDKGTESLKAILFNAGIYGQDANQGIVKEFQNRLDTDSNFKKNNNSILGGKNAVEYIDSIALEDLSGRAQILEQMTDAISSPELIKSSKEFTDSSNAMKANLKDLDTISGEYLVTLQNQSKHLKALNALSSSTSNLFKQLSSKLGGITNLSEFLSGITDSFQEMSQSKLPAGLQQLKVSLADVQKQAEETYKVDIGNAKGDKGLIALAQFNKTNDIDKKSKEALEAVGYKRMQDAQTAVAKYTVDTSYKLAELAASAANAAVATASLSAALKKTQFIAGLSTRASATSASAEYKTERQKVAVENKAKQSNIGALEEQKKVFVEALRGNLISSDGLSVEQLKKAAFQSVGNKNADIERKGALTSALSNLAGIEGAISIARADIKVNTIGLSDELVKEIDLGLKAIADTQNTGSDKLSLKSGKQAQLLSDEFNSITGIGSETADSLYEHESALLASTDAIEKQKLANKGLTDSLELLEKKLIGNKNLNSEQETAGIKVLQEANDKKDLGIQNLRKEEQAKAKLESTRKVETELKLFKEGNVLKTRSMELDELSGKISSESANIAQIRLATAESIFSLTEANNKEANASLATDIAKAEAARDHQIAVQEVNRELRIQQETLGNIEALFSSNKASTGLLNANQIQTINQAYTEILAKQIVIAQRKVDELSGNEKILAQEALRIEYLEKQLKLQESILEAKEKASEPFKLDKDLLAERFELDAKKFRDTLDSYNKTVVGASYKAVDTFVDGITNAVKTLDFNLKDIIRDTIFAFDDMMMEYAGNQLKAMMKDAISGYFKIDMRTQAEKVAEAQLSEAEKHTALLQKIADRESIKSSKVLSSDGLKPNLIQAIDLFGSSQNDMLKSQEFGFSDTELKAWGGSMATSSKEQTKSSSLIDSASTTMETVVRLFSNSSVELIKGLANSISSMFSASNSESSSGSSALGGLFSGIAGLFSGTSSSSMFAAQEAGFSAADLAAWGGSMSGFATGGQFKVGGRDGVDKNLVQFMATKGEQVIVKTPEQQKETSGSSMHVVNHFTITGGTTSRESQQQISAKVGASIQRAMARNN